MEPNNWFPRYLLNLYIRNPCQLTQLEQFDADILHINTYLANSNSNTNKQITCTSHGP